MNKLAFFLDARETLLACGLILIGAALFHLVFAIRAGSKRKQAEQKTTLSKPPALSFADAWYMFGGGLFTLASAFIDHTISMKVLFPIFGCLFLIPWLFIYTKEIYMTYMLYKEKKRNRNS